MHEPKIIVLDEPTRGMNQKDKDKIFNILNNEKKKGNIIIIASSNLNDIRGISNKIAFIEVPLLFESKMEDSKSAPGKRFIIKTSA